jgi:hypothetical protein
MGAKILAGVEAGIGVQAGIDGDRSGVAEKQRVAVGRALDESACADQARAAGAIIHHHLLAQRGRKLVRDDARHGIDAAAGRIRYDQRDGVSWIVFGQGVAAKRHSDRSGGRGPQQPAHRTLPFFLD